LYAIAQLMDKFGEMQSLSEQLEVRGLEYAF
jgi:hypothetical protein